MWLMITWRSPALSLSLYIYKVRTLPGFGLKRCGAQGMLCTCMLLTWLHKTAVHLTWCIFTRDSGLVEPLISQLPEVVALDGTSASWASPFVLLGMELYSILRSLVSASRAFYSCLSKELYLACHYTVHLVLHRWHLPRWVGVVLECRLIIICHQPSHCITLEMFFKRFAICNPDMLLETSALIFPVFEWLQFAMGEVEMLNKCMPLLDVQMPFRVAGARDCAPCQKWAKLRFCNSSKNDGKRGTFEKGSAKMHFAWQVRYKKHIHQRC